MQFIRRINESCDVSAHRERLHYVYNLINNGRLHVNRVLKTGQFVRFGLCLTLFRTCGREGKIVIEKILILHNMESITQHKIGTHVMNHFALIHCLSPI